MVVAGLFGARGAGMEPAEWLCVLSLPPLALLLISGLYVFAPPNASRWRPGRRLVA